MRIYWSHIWKSSEYRWGTRLERRMIELRFALARAVRAKRRAHRATQKELASLLGSSHQTISRIEQASSRVSIDQGLAALIVLGATDAEIVEVFDLGRNAGIQQLRKRMTLPLNTCARYDRRHANVTTPPIAGERILTSRGAAEHHPVTSSSPTRWARERAIGRRHRRLL
ncbi:MAG: helix-turn-helix domain-containing protein [Gemmatimonadota bacterium]